MGNFNDLFKKGTKVNFKYDGKDNPFITLDEYVKENEPTKDVLRGCWINPKSKYGPRGVLVIDGLNINVPTHLNEQIELIRSKPELVAQIDEGKAGIRYVQYEDRNGDVRNSVEFFDIED